MGPLPPGTATLSVLATAILYSLQSQNLTNCLAGIGIASPTPRGKFNRVDSPVAYL